MTSVVSVEIRLKYWTGLQTMKRRHMSYSIQCRKQQGRGLLRGRRELVFTQATLENVIGAFQVFASSVPWQLQLRLRFQNWKSKYFLYIFSIVIRAYGQSHGNWLPLLLIMPKFTNWLLLTIIQKIYKRQPTRSPLSLITEQKNTIDTQLRYWSMIPLLSSNVHFTIE